MRMRILAALVVSAIVAYGVTHGDHSASATAKRTAHHSYTSTDVIEYLAFATGPVVVDHPDLKTPSNMTGTSLTAEQTRTAAQRINECIASVDDGAGPALTDAINRGDPVRLDSALRQFNSAATRWLTTPAKQGVPCPPPPAPPSTPPSESGSAWLKVTGLVAAWHVAALANTVAAGVTVTVALAINVAGLVAVAAIVAATVILVPIFITYQFESMPSDLDRQNAIANIASTLRNS